MSVRLMDAVFKRYPEGGGEMLLALGLADHADDEGGSIYPSVAALSEKTRQSERTVQYQLRRMESAGWLLLVNAGNGGRGQRREYRINPDWINGADFAPIEKGANERKKGADFAPKAPVKGAIHDTKGANGSTKGCSPLHPHITINEPSKNHQGTISSAKSRKTRVPDDFGISDRVRKWAQEKGHTQLETHLEHFAGWARSKGATYVDWDEALMTAIRGNWAKVQQTSNRNGVTQHGNFAAQDYRAGVGADGSF